MEIPDSLGTEMDGVGGAGRKLTCFLISYRHLSLVGGLLPLEQFIFEWSHWLVPGISHCPAPRDASQNGEVCPCHL